LSIRPTGRGDVLGAHGGQPLGKRLREFIAMNSLIREPKPRNRAKRAAASSGTGGDQPRFVGVDLHKHSATFHILSQDGRTLHAGQFDVTPKAIERFAKDHLRSTDSLAVEVTSNTWAFVRLVRSHVAAVIVSNPLKTKAIAEANVKTDKVDARVIAHLLRCNYLPSVWLPTPATEHNRCLAARRTALVQERTAIRNRIHAILAQRLISPPAGGPFSDKGLNWLEQIDLDPLGRALINSDLRLLDANAGESAAVDRMIVEQSYDDPDVQLLMTMPGCDYTIAHALKATLGDISRFPSPDKAANYLGLVPRVKQSSDKCYHGSITKAGASQTRWLLVQAAHRIGIHPGPLGAFFRKLARRKNRNIAVVATARKLVTIAWHMLKNNEPYRYATPRSTDHKLASLRIRATGEKRKSGPPAGSKRSGKPGPAKTRATKPLDEVYQREGLPPRQPLSVGEKRMIRQSGTEDFVASLDQERIVTKPSARRVTSKPEAKSR
jgi:transposase